MVVTVRLKGLKIVQGRKPNSWYVYQRSTMDPILQGFEGSRDDLMRKLGEPELLQIYNRPRLRNRLASDFAIETLGGFVHWYTCGEIDGAKEGDVDGYPKWWKLAASTRKDYLEGYDYLRDDFDILLSEITQPDLYDTRDTCANRKWPRFADQMIAALSSMFKQAVKRKKMPFNPCLGMDKAHESDGGANREWLPAELKFVLENAPREILIPLMIARFAGLRGQTIVSINRKQFEPDPDGPTGMAVRYVPRKNKKKIPFVLLPVLPELQQFLGEIKLNRADGLIAVRHDGSPWPSEKEMQTRVSHWLRDRERAGKIGAGTTLHGLRVSYAAWWKRTVNADNRMVADLLGDASEAMGAHYTRHVEREVNIRHAFSRLKDKA
jgi:hypothetical protein